MTCPDEAALFALVRGTLAKGPAASIATHADSCLACQMALGEVARLEIRAEPPEGPKPLAPGDEIAGRFRLVERLADALRHPNLVTAREVITFEDRAPALVMELLRGESLTARLALGAMDPEPARAMMTPLCEAVAALHAVAIVHRDIKPSNVFLVGDSPRLLDLGLAKRLRGGADTRPTTAGKLLGTPRYMAPEQLVAVGDADEKADVWALGAILYEMLAGRPHIEAHRPTAVMRALATGIADLAAIAPKVPDALATLTMQMLRADRRERPRAGEVVAALRG